MRIFISSTPDELEPYRQVAADVVREFGHEPMLRDPAGRRGLDPITACDRQVALADAVLAVVGWRRGRVPTASLGGDGLRPWSYWQVQSAFAHSIPVVALLADEALAPEPREDVPEARAVVLDFRGDLARLGATFEDASDVRRLVRASLQALERAPSAPTATPLGLELRSFRPPELPAQPYPLLLPYTHPALLAGRDDDLADLRHRLARPVPVVGLHAASGTGKSSLLAGALVPALRAEGRPAALERHPTEPGLAARLIGDLIEGDRVEGDRAALAGGADGQSFADLLVAVRRLAGDQPPVLVIDQFESLLKDGAEAARADLGPLLAASAQRLPGLGGPACRWLLAYRQEYHGKLVEWLEDVLREARAAGRRNIARLPHDLSEPSRFVAGALRPLATPPSAADDPVNATTRVFLDTIEKPLRLKAPAGGNIYPWTFAPGHAERLARGFAEARVRQPTAPLVPELQVVLAHLLEQAGEPIDGQTITVEVPAQPAELIDRALEEHLRRALDFAFPRDLAAGDDEATRIARTRALLMLRELADGHGRREAGRGGDALARALGEQGHDVLEKLSKPRTRLVLLEQHSGSWVYRLAHDRLAQVLVKVVDEGNWAGLSVDVELLGLRRFVALQSQLHASGDAAQATIVTPGRFARIEANQGVFLWTSSQRTWWRACHARRHLERRHRWARRALAAAVVAGVALAAWTVADRRARRRALLAEVAAGEPEAALAALDRLTLERAHDRDELVGRLRERPRPFDVFERGLGGVVEERRPEVLVRVAQAALPMLEFSPEDPVLIASLAWALDFFAMRSGQVPPTEGARRAFAERAAALREEVLGPLHRSRPPPPRPGPNDPHWAGIPAGTFWMGSGPEEGSDETLTLSSQPRHKATVSAFRMLRHEVTNAELRRLFPDHQGADDLPALKVSWYRAYTYAAWLGGRLPTESEWEYAARAGCQHTFCTRDGSAATLDQVAWWQDNSADPRTGISSVKPVMRREANPWGLWDMVGNAAEWSANWYSPYGEAPETDPPGPTDNPLELRAARGGSAQSARDSILASRRSVSAPYSGDRYQGLRVVLGTPRRAVGATD